jgi:hypothetical protein
VVLKEKDIENFGVVAHHSPGRGRTVPPSLYYDTFKFLTNNLARYITILPYAIKGSKYKKDFTIIIIINTTLLSPASHI